MTDISLDPRLNAYRPDIANICLEGKVTSEQFIEAEKYHITTPSSFLRKNPGKDQEVVTQGLCGEIVDLFEIKNGWAWGQLRRDQYVGYMPLEDLSKGEGEAVLKVIVKHTHIYPEPDIRALPSFVYNFGARLSGEEHDETFFKTIAGGYIISSHLAPLEYLEEDFVAVAENFIGAPYLWGGKTSFGLDCSALVQISLQASGVEVPRDSDMQENAVGTSLPQAEWDQLQRGDLVFWKDHVGIMQNADLLVHANGHHMLVKSEPFKQARDRIASEYGEVTSIKRL